LNSSIVVAAEWQFDDSQTHNIHGYSSCRNKSRNASRSAARDWRIFRENYDIVVKGGNPIHIFDLCSAHHRHFLQRSLNWDLSSLSSNRVARAWISINW
jgi:hypothetical protein